MLCVGGLNFLCVKTPVHSQSLCTVIVYVPVSDPNPY